MLYLLVYRNKVIDYDTSKQDLEVEMQIHRDKHPKYRGAFRIISLDTSKVSLGEL